MCILCVTVTLYMENTGFLKFPIPVLSPGPKIMTLKSLFGQTWPLNRCCCDRAFQQAKVKGKLIPPRKSWQRKLSLWQG